MDIDSERPMGGTAAGATVLVVEDDPSLRLLCRVNLELEHHRVLEADTLSRAKELLEVEPIQVVLLDLHVGDEHGFELLPYIRGTRPDAGICLLSGTSESDPQLPDGVQGFIRKPFELEDLTGTVQRLLAQEPARRG
jgi:DNA-binding NtrC family response regulator